MSLSNNSARSKIPSMWSSFKLSLEFSFIEEEFKVSVGNAILRGRGSGYSRTTLIKFYQRTESLYKVTFSLGFFKSICAEAQQETLSYTLRWGHSATLYSPTSSEYFQILLLPRLYFALIWSYEGEAQGMRNHLEIKSAV